MMATTDRRFNVEFLYAFLRGVKEGFVGFFMTPITIYRSIRSLLRKGGRP